MTSESVLDEELREQDGIVGALLVEESEAAAEDIRHALEEAERSLADRATEFEPGVPLEEPPSTRVERAASINAPQARVFNPWIIALVVTMGTFMEVLDTSIANVALPHIAGQPVGLAGRKHVGADQLPGGQRDHSADQRLDFERLGPQEFLSDFCRRCSRYFRPPAALRPRWARW